MSDLSIALSDIFPPPVAPQQVLAVIHAIQAGIPELGPGGHFPPNWQIDPVTRTTLLAWCQRYEHLCEKELGIEARFTPITEEELRADGWFDDALFPD